LLVAGRLGSAEPARPEVALHLVSILTEPSLAGPARHGLNALEAALRAKGVAFNEVANVAAAHGATWIVAGIADQPGPAAELATALKARPAATPEALLVRRGTWHRTPAVLVEGSDAVGLMYALLDLADRVSWATDSAHPLSEVKDVAEQPAVAERGVSIYTMQQAWFENRLHDEAYWTRYFDTMVKNRFNTFSLLFAYEMEGYLFPPYPYFFDTPGFSDVKVVGQTAEQQRRNLDDLNRLIRMAHERGLKVTIGIWDHIYRAKAPTPGLVWGLTDANLRPFTKAAMATLFREVPGIDRLMLLMHNESGLRPADMHDFWAEVLRAIHAAAPNLPIEARAKGVPDDIIADAQSAGIDIRMNTKFWAEQVGLPYPPTHIQALSQFDRRHGYSDMLNYPHAYDLHYTLWTSGTTRILLWGDPDYVRRLVGTLSFGGPHGFDVLEPLATRMAGHPQTQKPLELLQAPYRYYDYEFERYWHFFQVFGRVSYNPATSSEVWDHEFVRRFGPQSGPLLEAALHSQILPRIVAYCLPPDRFPTTCGWPEKQRWDDLPQYARSEPSDTQQFQSFDEAAQCILDGTELAKISPLETQRWFERAAADVLLLADQAEAHRSGPVGKEFVSTVTDLHILAHLARYHAARIPAGIEYAIYLRNHDATALDAAIADEQRAAEAWRGVIVAAGDVYADDLAMGLASWDLSGHWRDELVKIQAGIAVLQQERVAYKAGPKNPSGPWTVPTSGVLAGVMTAPLPNGNYEISYSMKGPAGPMWVEANGSDYSPLVSVPAGAQQVQKLRTGVRDGKLELAFHATSDGTWNAGLVTARRLDPWVAPLPEMEGKLNLNHQPPTLAEPHRMLRLVAIVKAGSGVKWVHARYRGLTQHQDFKTVTMFPTQNPNEFQGIIPSEDIDPKFDFMYFFEVMDQSGQGKIFPDLNRETPYWVVPVRR
jgi:hypothetical protein